MTASPTAITQINIIARDIEKSAAFYRELGVELPTPASPPQGPRHLAGPTGDGARLEIDDEQLACFYNAALRASGSAARLIVGVSLGGRDEVDALFATLVAAGHPALQQPYDAFWGARYAIVADPDGHAVGLMSPIDASRKSWPPTNSPA